MVFAIPSAGRLLRLEPIPEQLDIRPEPLADQLRQLIGVIAAVILLAVLRLALVRQRRGFDTDAAAGFLEVGLQVFGAADEIHQHLAVQVDAVVRLQFDAGIDVVLVRALRVELPAQELLEGFDVRHQMRAFAADVVEGTDLQVPRIAHEHELEELLEQLVRQHLLRRDDLRVPRKLDAEPVPAQPRQPRAQELRVEPRIAQPQRPQRIAHRGAAGLGGVDEQEVVLQRQQHVGASARGLREGAMVGAHRS